MGESYIGTETLLRDARYKSETIVCHGCENNCAVMKYDFGGSHRYYSGNRCEKIFSNGEKASARGRNAYEEKLHLLFDRASVETNLDAPSIGIPRVLNMFEDFPFWHSLLTSCGFRVILSGPSGTRGYEANARMVMSDNICFPAKLVHAHIAELKEKGVDRMFFPFVVHGPRGKDQNSYNCPIVAGYSQVVKDCGVPFDSPVISMKDRGLFLLQCKDYLKGLGVSAEKAEQAFGNALQEQQAFERGEAGINRRILSARNDGDLVIMLAGRPYHCDPLIQHNVSGMIASLGVDVITDDLVRDEDIKLDDVDFLSQWTFTNRILRAAKWCAEQGPGIQFVEMTSFGCGPDAFMLDSVRDLLSRHGKSLTVLKLDDISNVGSMKLRVRSLIDSIALKNTGSQEESSTPYVTTPSFKKEDKQRTIIIPFFTPFLSPLIPAVMKKAGYNVICLPESDQKSADIGLKYANNEVCYPASLVVGDIIKALQKGGLDLDNIAVAMTQTGGQCRASNYLSLIKKAMVDAGFGNVPVISVSFGSGIENQQPGFKINWPKIIPVALHAILFSDTLAKLYYPAVVRQKEKGVAERLKDHYLERASEMIEDGRSKDLLGLAEEAARDFDGICDDTVHPKVGIVGEIYLKFNPFAHHNLPAWLMEKGVETAPPVLTDFFTQYFVNQKTNKKNLIQKGGIPDWLLDQAYRLLEKQIRKYDEACARNRFYSPFNDIFKEAGEASEIISLGAQFGEGWLLPGEIATYHKRGVKNVLSLQPFGCIANHIVVRGVEKRIKHLFPDINLLAVDFDGGVSEVNIINRMLLFVNNLVN